MTHHLRFAFALSAFTRSGVAMAATMLAVALGPAAAAEGQVGELIYLPWQKFCGKGSGVDTREVCFTGKDARTEAGRLSRRR